MINLLPFIAACFLVGCSTFNRTEEPQDLTPSQELQEVYSANLASYSFGEPSDCDAALWVGVYHCATGDGILDHYLYPGNQPQRRAKISCYPTDLNGDGRPDSRSTISNDGIIGLSMCDSEIANRILDYRTQTGGFMGEPREALGEVVIKPNVLIVLQGSDTPTFYAPPKEDYQYHIQVQLILWEGRKYGKISKNALDRLKGAADAYPDDCLFNAALGLYTGDMSRATELALSGVNPSSYVRGDDRYPMANWLQCAALILGHHGG